MPVKVMRGICFHPKTPSFASPSRTTAPSTPTSRHGGGSVSSLSGSAIEKIIQEAAVMVEKWNPEATTYARVTSLFYENKREAAHFVKCVNGLQRAMHALLLEDPTSAKLVTAQGLMQVAMKRLQKEFYQILSMNRAHLDPESVSARSSRVSARSSISDYSDDGLPEDDASVAGASIFEVEEASSVAMADLRSIAECMITSGYAKECVSIYQIIRKSIIDEGLYRLGVEKLSHLRIGKMDWEVLEVKIKSWLDAVKVSMRTLFTGERILCDHVFASSDTIRESCFSAISRDGAMLLFGFPEFVARSKRSSPEKIFRLLDMYNAISAHWVEIESIFVFESTATVRSQAITALVRLGESVRAMLADFEASMQKRSSKSLVSGGGVHPLTVQSMNSLSLLADYSNIVVDIFGDEPAPAESPLPESYFDSPHREDGPTTVISQRIAWLILVLLCKLDSKAKRYKDISLSYLFLANNLQHVVSKVRESNLHSLLGEDWITRHEKKVRQFAANYARLAWEPVLSTLPEDPSAPLYPAEAGEHFRSFNSSFEEAYRKQRSAVVPDPNLRDDIKASIERKLGRAYKAFYDIHRLTVGGERNGVAFARFAPQDIGNYISDLFFGSGDSSNASSSSSSLSSHRRRSHTSH
ncbi:exocyst complex component EXO70H1-like [Punica granatum]|uniref:Exocyst subunit Exo70 family protein n=2 Tax=Punica granatum TaxID=22663 RepID=A0A2I0K1Z7_PUNGR|nr:exocyst complex component EXO70H1-like [Punica granatum]PKI62150.1 hypothetical protein CRG98_017523 [Punica granatum]